MDLPPDIFSLDGPVIYFPVRHHSPTAALMVRELIQQQRPKAVLIEGPSDFNDRLNELDLPHELPIAIYSYVRNPDDTRRGGYYPFCIYSPEWQAFLAARRTGALVRFIDLPYADLAGDRQINRYADADFRRSAYVKQLCTRLGVDSFDTVWDSFFELDRGMTPEKYLRLAHQFCGQMRLIEGQSRDTDRRREAFMASQIRKMLSEQGGPILVVTGGYHSLALHARLNGSTDPNLVDPAEHLPAPLTQGEERGIALTPYSYHRLDSLTGYDAGMPNPGYYHRMWQDRQANKPIAHRKLMFDVARALRDRKQRVSAADLIAAESCASALARIRGHGEVWRTDLLDGLIGALIKDELTAGGTHPLLDAAHEVLRGNARGALAEGAALPPLVRDLQRLLQEADLQPLPAIREITLDLSLEPDRQRSRLLHRLQILGIAGFTRLGGTDFTSRNDLSRLWEKWSMQWNPEFDSSAIEAARYGPTLADAAANRLTEQARALQRSAEQGAILLLRASLADLNAIASTLHAQLEVLVNQDGEFLSVTAALSHLLYLYQFDETMATRGRADVGHILREAFSRGLWLLETLGQMIDPDGQTVRGVAHLLDAFERCEQTLALDRIEFFTVLNRVVQDRAQGAAIRGAALGALWVLNQSDSQQVQTELKLFADPQHLGDFLTGLFAIAREVVQRERELLLAIDQTLAGYADEDFLAALPSLRLAFTYFTPREKHYMAKHLLEALGIAHTKPLASLSVRPEDAARAMARESALFAALKQYGLRGAES
jgi:hypothetical protein